jgi:hypothetical protein
MGVAVPALVRHKRSDQIHQTDQATVEARPNQNRSARSGDNLLEIRF